MIQKKKLNKKEIENKKELIKLFCFALKTQIERIERRFFVVEGDANEKND